MKERYALVRRPFIEHQSMKQRATALGRVYRGVGRIFLLGAAVSASVDIVNSVLGRMLPLITLRSVLEISPYFNGEAFAPFHGAFELAVDSPLSIILVIVAAIPYALAIERFIRVS